MVFTFFSLKKFNKIDILVNNAGINIPRLLVDSQNAVHPDLHIFLKGGEVHGEAEEVFNVKPSDGEGLHGEKLGNGVDVGAGGDLRVFKRQAGEILLDEFDAIAKLRNDPQEVGEVKKVVNTLLQCLDSRKEKGFRSCNGGNLS